MINLKSDEEIRIMQEGGQRLHRAVELLLPFVKAGLTTEEVDKEAERLIIAQGGESSFKRVPGYYWTTCLAVNEQAVHTPPSKRVLKEGDELTIDIGIYYQGYHVDYATTIVIGGIMDQKVKRFLETGQETLKKAISKAKSGHYLGEIAREMEKGIQGNGYFILKDLTGHGVGKELHEDPYVLNYVDRPIDKTYKIRPGLVIAIEIIYSMGTEQIVHEKGNDWSIITRDKSLAACFEETVAITDKNTLILT